MFKNITQTQWVAFVIGAAGFLGGATGQLTTLFGSDGASYIASGCALVSGLAGVFLMATTGQVSQLKTVAAIQGDDGKPAVRVNVNANATDGVAAAALDPTLPNVGAITPEVRATLITKAAS
jgi:hypothetical protein